MICSKGAERGRADTDSPLLLQVQPLRRVGESYRGVNGGYFQPVPLAAHRACAEASSVSIMRLESKSSRSEKIALPDDPLATFSTSEGPLAFRNYRLRSIGAGI